eukprot:scaffold19601_cov51-Phaeocystis_antarctica.AAC.2
MITGGRARSSASFGIRLVYTVPWVLVFAAPCLVSGWWLGRGRERWMDPPGHGGSGWRLRQARCRGGSPGVQTPSATVAQHGQHDRSDE